MKLNSSFIISLLFVFSLQAQTDSSSLFKEINDLAYLTPDLIQNDTLQRLNLVLPNDAEDCPLLLWIGGGAWSFVNRNMEMNLARRFAQEGIAVASVGHRLSSALWRDSSFNGGAQHPDHIEDIAAAFKWLYDQADTYGYDAQKIFVGGFSSGAHLAALLSLDESYLKKHGLSKSNIKGLIPISGAYDISNYHEVFQNGSQSALADSHVKSVFGKTEADFIAASPTSYLEHLSVPILLLSDNYVYRYTQLFEDRLEATAFRDFNVLYVYQLNHGDLWRHLAQETSIYRTVIRDFIEQNSTS